MVAGGFFTKIIGAWSLFGLTLVESVVISATFCFWARRSGRLA